QTSGKDCVVARDGQVNYQALRGQLRYQPDDRIDINIIGDYSTSDNNNAAGILVFGDMASPNIRGNADAVPLDSRFICGRYCNYASYYSPADTFNGSGLTDYPLVETRGDGRTRLDNWGVSGQIDIDLSDDLQLQSI